MEKWQRIFEASESLHQSTLKADCMLPRFTRTTMILDTLRRLRYELFSTSPTGARCTTKVMRCDPTSITFTDDPISPYIEIIDIQTSNTLKTAANLIHDCKPVAFPTETVYGLGALALNSKAASRIFSTKGRPPDNPLIVHVSSQAMLRRLLLKDYKISRVYEVLMKHFLGI